LNQELPRRRDRWIAAAPADPKGDCGGGLLFVKRPWTAEERTAPKIKSQEAIRVPRNADPYALPDFAGFVVTASEP